MNFKFIYKICTKSELNDAKDKQKFEGSKKDLDDGFIHFSGEEQVKETLKKLMNLSAYVNKSLIEDSESIWIAQLEGRANDVNDITDPAVLKMLHLSQIKEKVRELTK